MLFSISLFPLPFTALNITSQSSFPVLFYKRTVPYACIIFPFYFIFSFLPIVFFSIFAILKMYAYQTPALLFQAADTYINFIKGGIFFMDTYVTLKDLAIIIVFANCLVFLPENARLPGCGRADCRYCLGPSVLGLVQQSDFLAQMAGSVSFC